MWKQFRGGVLFAVVCGLIPMALTESTASAQLFNFFRGCRNCQQPEGNCNCQSRRSHCHCQRPAGQCNCGVQQPVVQQQVYQQPIVQQPVVQQQVMQQQVVETRMVPQQTTVMRNEVVTQYRQEAVTQSVPVTAYRNVVVDEGGYQMVYVPKQVTKQVPEVTYQQQIAYRSVPFQTTRQVPQVVTQMVPQQIVRTQPVTYQTTQMMPMAPVSVARGCAPCGTASYGVSPYSTIGQTYVPAPTVASPLIYNPVTMLPPTTSIASPTLVYPQAEVNSNPVPDPKFLDSPGATRDSWSTIGSRNGGRTDTSYEDSRTSNSGSIRFKPASTVYRSWETQSRVAAGESPSRQ
ncbi:MAG: hypothetical protein NT013_15070 [Planctomycetia bacterium]|nr:hypothetical protein [Planctomycetia bacterium]